MARVAIQKYTADISGVVTAQADASWSEIGSEMFRVINPLNLIADAPAPVDARVATGTAYALGVGGFLIGHFVTGPKKKPSVRR